MISPIAIEFSVVCLGIFLLMLDSFSKADKEVIGWTAIAGLALALVATFFLGPVPAQYVEWGFYLNDSLALFFKRFMLLAAMLTVFLAIDYAPVYLRYVPSETPKAGLGEFFILPVFACAGLMWMVSAADFIMIFVALELVTISFYVLVATMRKNLGSLEAGVKYLILGALSTGFLVYGITWIFGLTRTTNLLEVANKLPYVTSGYEPAVLFGLALILVGLGFKIAAVPFQFWVPDVYQGAPTPVTAYLSVASKAAGFIVLWRVLVVFLSVPAYQEKIIAVLTVLAAVTLVLGNLAALPQTNLKRLLAYSSIAHAGYLLVGIASIASPLAYQAVAFYLGGYLLMTFLSFLILINVSKASGGDDISDFNGLGRRSPILALGLLVAMLSLAGLPFTVGFLGKALIFIAAYQAGQYVLVFLGIITVAAGFYYYLKVVRAMYWQPAIAGATEIRVSPLGKAVIGLLCLAIIVLGIFPQPVLGMLK